MQGLLKAEIISAGSEKASCRGSHSMTARGEGWRSGFLKKPSIDSLESGVGITVYQNTTLLISEKKRGISVSCKNHYWYPSRRVVVQDEFAKATP